MEEILQRFKRLRDKHLGKIGEKAAPGDKYNELIYCKASEKIKEIENQLSIPNRYYQEKLRGKYRGR